jgi:hypothetical protein
MMGQRWPLRNIIRPTSRLPAPPAASPLTGGRAFTDNRADSLLDEPGTDSSRPAVIGHCGARRIGAAYLGGRPSGGRMGAMAGPPWGRGPDHSAGTASTAAATA